MSDVDSLSRLTRALRESRTGRHADPGATKAAIVTEAGAKRKHRRVVVVWLVPLAAVLVISTAVASVGSARRFVWQMYLQRMVGGDRGAPVATAAMAATNLVEPAPVNDTAVENDDEPAAAKEPDPPAAPRVQPVVKVVKRSTSASSAVPPPAATSSASPADAPPPAAPAAVVEDVDGRLYARAHEAHFVRRNAAAALAAWDDYLAAEPDGRFVLEARYNRALCLVRVDRLDEAKAALQPFRDGRFGSYRQLEATRLLDALSRR